jgi:phosphatidate phosphatase PAH1
MKSYIFIFSVLVIVSGCDSETTSNNSQNNLNNINNLNNSNNNNDGGIEDADDGGDVVEPVLCEEDNTFFNPPAFSFPPEEDWNHSVVSASTAGSGAPYHMIHDEMVLENSEILVSGKFDYNKVVHKDLQDENILVYIWGTGYSDWELLGRYLTNDDGKISMTIEGKSQGQYILKGVVAGDLTVAHGYITVVKPNKKAVIFDIDGTITTSDSQVMTDWANFSPADMYSYADLTVKYYYEKGFQIVMVTGRPYWLASNSRDWLENLGFPFHSIRFTSNTGTTVSGEETQAYKTDYLNDLITRCQLNIIRAYGNADTDIAAYNEVGIPKSETFIIGENAGLENTQPIDCEECGYQDHYNNLIIPENIICTIDE